MNIRSATIQDRPALVDLLVKFSSETPVGFLKNPEFNQTRIMRQIDAIQRSGIVLVAERQDELVGMIMGITVEDLWLPQKKYIREVAWYVLPEHRGSSAGFRLLKKYTEECELAIKHGLVCAAQLTTLTTSPDLKLEKRGWEPVETNWILES